MDGTKARRQTSSCRITLDHNQAKRAGIAAFVGTSVEWFYYFNKRTASALVLVRLFILSPEDTAGILLALATSGVGYLARPIGGIIFGHLGDRVGRKKTLLVRSS